MARVNRSPKPTIATALGVRKRVAAKTGRRGISVSAGISDAVRLALKIRDGLAAVAEWEAEHGKLTEAEQKAARQRLASSRRPARTTRRRHSR